MGGGYRAGGLPEAAVPTPDAPNRNDGLGGAPLTRLCDTEVRASIRIWLGRRSLGGSSAISPAISCATSAMAEAQMTCAWRSIWLRGPGEGGFGGRGIGSGGGRSGGFGRTQAGSRSGRQGDRRRFRLGRGDDIADRLQDGRVLRVTAVQRGAGFCSLLLRLGRLAE